MENYENLGTVGEGTYGIVMKCRHKETGQLVAIKKFKESDEDEQVKKTAMREVRILKQLRHDNIVNLIEIFRKKGKLYLVFEYLEGTILGKIEENPYGLAEEEVKKYMYQLLKGIQYCHMHNVSI
jgi:cyclin-dependent kinase-like